MAKAIRFYLCPLVADPSGDPFRQPVPHTWIRSAGGSAYSVALPGGNYCLLRMCAESTALDALEGSGAPNGFRRFPLAATWSQLPNNVRNFMSNNWPVVANAMQNGDTLGLLALRLYRQVNAGGQLSDFRQPATDGDSAEG